MKIKLTDAVAVAIGEYTGKTPSAVMGHRDPMVAGTFAFRALFEGDMPPMDFLTIGVPLSKITDEDLEDSDWSEWPPKSEGRVTQWMVS